MSFSQNKASYSSPSPLEPLSAKNSKSSNDRASILRVGNTGDGFSEPQSQLNLSFIDKPAYVAKANREGLKTFNPTDFEGLYVHEIIEKQLFYKNEPHQRHQIHPQDSKSNQTGLGGRGRTRSENLRLSRHASTTGTGGEGHTMVMNPMLRRLSKKRRKKILKQQEDQPFDPRKQEEMILLEMAPHQQIEYISKSTHFSTAEVRDLQKMFKNITKSFGTPDDMNRALFRIFFIQVLDITDSVMLDQVFNYFDAGGEGSISVTEFLSNLSIIIRGSIDEHIKFCYAIYDLNGDGGIGRAEVMTLIRYTLNAPLDDDDDMNDSIRDMANMIMTQLDSEGTGQITIDSFREGVMRDPLSLQILGPCLPEERRIRTFMSLIIWDYKDFATNYSLPLHVSYPEERLRYHSVEDRIDKKTLSLYFKQKNAGK